MKVSVIFNLNYAGAPPDWLVPLIEGVITPLFKAQIGGLEVLINVGGEVPTPAQTEALKGILTKVNSIDAPPPTNP